MASETTTQEEPSTMMESVEYFQETKRLEEAAKNNRLHQLPHELLCRSLIISTTMISATSRTS